MNFTAVGDEVGAGGLGAACDDDGVVEARAGWEHARDARVVDRRQRRTGRTGCSNNKSMEVSFQPVEQERTDSDGQSRDAALAADGHAKVAAVNRDQRATAG